MSIEVMRYVWNKSKAKGNARLMLLAIADMTNDHGDTFPGVERLAKKCALSRRRAQQIIQDLERSGELEVYENVGMKTSSGWTNLYRVKMEGVSQSIVRNKENDIVLPRVPPNKKARSFPDKSKDVQPVAPLKDVQPVAPHDMKPVAPHDVQPVAPESSVNPKITNTITLDVASDAKPKPIPKAVIDPMKDAIVSAFGWSWETMTKGEKGLVQTTAKELCTVGFEVARVGSLYAWCKAKFSNFGPRCLSQHLSEYRAARLNTPEKDAQMADLASYKPKDPNEYIGVQNNVA